MFRMVLLFACLAAGSAHGVLPLAHSVGYSHGYGGLGLGHGYAGHDLAGHLGFADHGHFGYGHGHGLLGHGYGAHHILKRSPHIVHGAVGHLGHAGGHLGAGYAAPVVAVGHVAPVAVSHQSRVDVRSSPALVAPVLPVPAPVVAPVIHAAPIHHAPLAPLHYGLARAGYGSHYGSAYPHLGHY